MLALLVFLLKGRWPCVHHWKILREVNLVSPESDGQFTGTRYVLQCDKCGVVKKKDCD